MGKNNMPIEGTFYEELSYQIVCARCRQNPCICDAIQNAMKEKANEKFLLWWWGKIIKLEPTPWDRFELVNKGELIQRVVNPQEVNKYLVDGWVFRQELKSGDILIEKLLDTAKIAETAITQEKQRLQKI